MANKIAMFVYEHRVSIEIENGTSRQVSGKTFADVISEMPIKDKETMHAMATEILAHCKVAVEVKQVN